MPRSSPLKWKLLRRLSTQVKICQIPHVNFEMTHQFLSKWHYSPVSSKITHLYFFSWNNMYFAQKEPIKVKWSDFRVLRSNFMTFLMSGLKQQDNSSPTFVYLFIQCYERYLLCTFSAQTIYAFLKRSPLKRNLETFEHSGQNWSNSSSL